MSQPNTKNYSQLKKSGNYRSSLPDERTYQLIVQNQKLLRRPLVVDEHRLQVGYNEDDIRKFLTRKVRQLGMMTAIENVRIWDQAK